MAGLWVLPTELDDASSPDAPYAAEAASWILYRLTGAKYPGINIVSEWYGNQTTQCMFGCFGSLALQSTIAAGVTNGLFPHSHIRFAVDSSPRLLRLRSNPVLSISSISLGVSGTQLDPSSYSLVNRAYLIQSDGNTPWDLTSGVMVTYTYGMMPPEAGRRAAITLANEIVKCINGDDTCRLPDRVTSVTREGVTMTVLDPQEYIKEGRTGLYEIDLFINAANPTGALKKAKVFSPDVPRGERRR